MRVEKSTLIWERLAWLSLWLWGTSAMAYAQQRYPIDTQMVASALSRRGRAVSAEQVTMPMRVTAATPSPDLEIVRAGGAADGGVRVQLRCAQLGGCVSFVAVVHVPQEEKVGLLQLAPGSHEQSGPEFEKHLAAGTVRAESHPDAEALLHPGEPVILWMEDNHLRIHIPVVALDFGERGQLIRVATADRKKVFSAIVLDKENAKGVNE